MTKRGIMGLMALGALAGCAAAEQPEAPRYAAGQFRAHADLAGADGKAAGRAVVREDAGDLVVTVGVAGLAAGAHGLHIHGVGKCEGPAFASAGPHWNPAGKQHGTLNPLGHHLGDAPEVVVGADGTGTVEFRIAGTRLDQLLDEDGAALVVHADPDDMKTDPSGNSGARIACGVVVAD